MKHFKLVHTDGTVEELEADRVVRDDDTIYADSRIDGRWLNMRRREVDQIDDVRRRITDFNGQLRWISHRTTYLPSRFDVVNDETATRSTP